MFARATLCWFLLDVCGGIGRLQPYCDLPEGWCPGPQPHQGVLVSILPVGPDNMDLALAYALRAKLEADGKSISDMQFLSLTHSAGKAKVAMLEDGS